MVHIGANMVFNGWTSDVYLAYSADNPNGKWDIWVISKLTPGHLVSSVDVDYIRAATAGTSLQYIDSKGKIVFTAPAPTWVKIRQFSDVNVTKLATDAKIGRIVDVNYNFINGRPPNPALDEAALYDGKDEEAQRGTKQVKEDIKEWEDMIKANQFRDIQKLPNRFPRPQR